MRWLANFHDFRFKWTATAAIRTRQTWLLSALLLAAASRHHEENHLIYGPLESILLDQGFPVEYEWDEFNPPHTGTTLRHLQNLAMSTAMQNSTQTSSHWSTLSGDMLLSQNNQDHPFMDDDNVHVLNQQTTFATPMVTIHIYQPLRSGRIWLKVSFFSGV